MDGKVLRFKVKVKAKTRRWKKEKKKGIRKKRVETVLRKGR